MSHTFRHEVRIAATGFAGALSIAGVITIAEKIGVIKPIALALARQGRAIVVRIAKGVAKVMKSLPPEVKQIKVAALKGEIGFFIALTAVRQLGPTSVIDGEEVPTIDVAFGLTKTLIKENPALTAAILAELGIIAVVTTAAAASAGTLAPVGLPLLGLAFEIAVADPVRFGQI